MALEKAPPGENGEIATSAVAIAQHPDYVARPRALTELQRPLAQPPSCEDTARAQYPASRPKF